MGAETKNRMSEVVSTDPDLNARNPLFPRYSGPGASAP